MNEAVNMLILHVPRLLEQLPRREAGQPTLLVTFPAHAQRALAKGTGRLMQSGGRTLPTVVSTETGRILAQGSVVSSAGVGALATGSAAPAAGTAALAIPPLLPVIAVAVVAVGAV